MQGSREGGCHHLLEELDLCETNYVGQATAYRTVSNRPRLKHQGTHIATQAEEPSLQQLFQLLVAILPLVCWQSQQAGSETLPPV